MIYAADGDELAPLFARGPAAPPAFGPRRASHSWCRGAPNRRRAPRRRPPFWQRWTQGGRRSRRDGRAARRAPRARDERLRRLSLPRREEVGRHLHRDGWGAPPASLAEGVGAELRRFGEEATRSARKSGPDDREAPPLRAGLDRRGRSREGGALEEGEREVTVLFVDVRGYTSFAQERAGRRSSRSMNPLHPSAMSRGGARREGHDHRVQRRRHDGGLRRAARRSPQKEGAAVAPRGRSGTAPRALHFGWIRRRPPSRWGSGSPPGRPSSAASAPSTAHLERDREHDQPGGAPRASMTRELSTSPSRSTKRPGARAASSRSGSSRSAALPIRGRSPLEVFALPLTE